MVGFTKEMRYLSRPKNIQPTVVERERSLNMVYIMETRELLLTFMPQCLLVTRGLAHP